MLKTFLKTVLISSLLAGIIEQAGWFAQASEAYFVQGPQFGWRGLSSVCTKPIWATRGWRNFTVNFQGGCPRFVHFNAQNGQVTVPN